MERHFVFGVSVGGADVVFVGVHEASRNVVVHHPRLNCRLLFFLIDSYCCVMCRRGLYVGGCWFALRIMWAWASGGGYHSGVVVLSLHNKLLYASG